MAGRDLPRQEWLVERQRSMIRRAANEGLSNLVHFALSLDEVTEVDPAQLVTDGKDKEDSPLLTACEAGHLDVVKDMVERCNASVQSEGKITTEGITCTKASPLWCAAASGNLELVKYLINRGAKVDQGETFRKSTPLRAAVFKLHVPVAKYLVQKGADVNSTNSKGHSVLMTACGKDERSAELARILLDNGADINYVVPAIENSDFSGWTALHQSAREGNKEVVELLICRGATITRNADGETPLLLAAHRGHDDCVFALLEAPDCSRDDKADALELLGTEYLNRQDTDTKKCLSLWKKAMEERTMPDRPVARKREAERMIAAYKNVVEVQTMAELRSMESRQDEEELIMQALLIRERVLGPEHSATVDMIRFIAAVEADKEQYSRAVELLIHALSNQENIKPSEHLKMGCYSLIINVFVEAYQQGKDKNSLRFKDVLRVLEMSVRDITRWKQEQTPAKPDDEELEERRVDMLKVPLHLLVLGHVTENEADQQDIQRFSQAVGSLVRMGLRGKEGTTLLHMACAKETSKLYDGYEGCAFPTKRAVKALLKAGSDVNSQDEGGRTALQVALAQTDADVSEVVEMLRGAGAR